MHSLLVFATEAVKMVIREFVLPYTKELAECIHEAGAAFGYHICGDTTKTTADMAGVGGDFLSVDNQADLFYLNFLKWTKCQIYDRVDKNK